MADIKFGKAKTAKAIKNVQGAGYTVLCQDGTILTEAPAKAPKSFPKKVATLVGVATAGIAGGLLAGKAFFGEHLSVSPDTVEAAAEALTDAISEAETAEVVDAVNDLVDAAL